MFPVRVIVLAALTALAAPALAGVGSATVLDAPHAACDVPLTALVGPDGVGPMAPRPASDTSCDGIRPGTYMTSPAGCTFNFVFADENDKLYIGTAGHCVDSVGQRVAGGNGIGEFGTVVYRIEHDVGNDFALIAIDDDRYAEVTPAMCHWGGPVAGDPGANAELGTDLKQYGHGVATDWSEELHHREGDLIVWETEYWRALIPVSGGDSGSAIMTADGHAIGVVTHLSFSFSYPDHPESAASTSSGTRIDHAIAVAEAGLGLDLTLLTAPLA